jgi:amphi-Trp domain-containing protein
MDSERSLEFSAYCEPAQVADYLEALARHVREGRVELAVGSESVQLAFSPNVKLELAAKTKPEKGKGSLEIEVSWRQPPHFEEPLRIEAGEETTALEIAGGKRSTNKSEGD